MSFKAILLVSFFLFFYLFVPQNVYASFATQSATLQTSARVKARPQDLQLLFTSNANQVVGADQEIEYTITYGSLLDYRTPMTIEAEWSLGTIKDQNINSYNIISYVPGSATKDYWGGSAPVVDVKKRKIVWKIESFPRNTIDKTLKFSLRTPGSYITDQQVNFSVSAKLSTDEVSVPQITLDQTYNPTEFINTEVRGLHITTADITRITDTSFSINLVTTVPTRVTVYYGLTLDLDQTFVDNNLTEQRLIVIDNLKPATTYYFKILVENEKGIQRKTPEYFTVTTAAHSLLSLVDPDRLLVSSQGIPLLQGYWGGYANTILIPIERNVEVYLPFLKNPQSSVYLSVVDEKVLGTSNDVPISAQKVRLLESNTGLFTGLISLPTRPGTYDLVVEAQDTFGTINQDVLTKLLVVTPIRIVNERGSGIEDALVYIERFNSLKGKFERFPSESFGYHNPVYTTSGGITDLMVPEGNYSLNVNAIGYETYQGKFLLTLDSKEYPTITLKAGPFSLRNYLSYYWNASIDSLSFLNRSVDLSAQSSRFLNLLLFLAVTILSVFSIILNLHRIKFTLEGGYVHVEKLIGKLTGRPKAYTLFFGFVEEAGTGSPLHNAEVTLTYRKEKYIIGRSLTNTIGGFHLNIEPGRSYEMTIRRKDFASLKTEIDSKVLFENPPPFSLTRVVPSKRPMWYRFVQNMAHEILHGVSDTLLFILIGLNIVLIGRLGLAKILPLAVVSVINVLLWLDYQWKSFRIKKMPRS